MVELLGEFSRDVRTLIYTGNVLRLRELLDGERRPDALMWLPAESTAAREIARLLLEHGADPTLRHSHGQSAADIAESRGMDDVAALLRGSG